MNPEKALGQLAAPGSQNRRSRRTFVNADKPREPVPAQVEAHVKTVLLKSGKLPQIFRCVSGLGFTCSPDGRYLNSSPESNIQEIAVRRDTIDGECIWLVVRARNPFSFAQTALQSCAERRQSELEQNLRLAKEYWLRIQGSVKDRKLRGAELYVATDAHSRLRRAATYLTEWRGTEYGRRSAGAEEIPDWGQPVFREPEELCTDEGLTPETLARIAASLMRERTKVLTSAEAVLAAHDLLMAAERYVATLPKQKRGSYRIIEGFQEAFSTVKFVEIYASNRKSSGKLPLLPAIGQKHKNVPEQEQRERPLTVQAIREAVRRYLEEQTPHLTREEYERDQEQTHRLAEGKKLTIFGGRKTRTYQQWQGDNQRAIEDFMKESRISIQDLCNLRWARFERQWQLRQRIALNRKPPQRKVRSEKPPSSAASSPQAAGKSERLPSARTVKNISRARTHRLQ